MSWLKDRASDLRGWQTDAEVRLGAALRGWGFQEQRPIFGYILDFYHKGKLLAVEADGSHHNSGPQLAHDRKREQILKQHGIRVLRFSNYRIKNDLNGVLHMISFALKHSTPKPAGQRRSQQAQPNASRAPSSDVFHGKQSPPVKQSVASDVA